MTYIPNPNYPDMSSPVKQGAAVSRARDALAARFFTKHKKLANDVLGLSSYVDFLESQLNDAQNKATVLELKLQPPVVADLGLPTPSTFKN